MHQIIQEIYSTVWIIFLLVVAIKIIKTRWFKGIYGEFLVNAAARVFLQKNDYHLLKDVTLPSQDGTTQIDHVIVSRYGVFVIETKNMGGVIYASSRKKYWSQRFYKRSYKFQNPLHQNHKHVKTIEALLSVPFSAIHTLVVFVGSSTFKTDMPYNVTGLRGFVPHIKSKRKVLISQANVKSAIEKIEKTRLKPGIVTNWRHVRYLRNKKASS